MASKASSKAPAKSTSNLTFKGWRRETAHADGVPPYVIFCIATLAEMVRAKPNTLPALGRISGIGEAKLKKYGTEVLAVLIAGV